MELGRPPTPPRRSVLSADVVGRDKELAWVREAVEAAAGGTGGVLFVVGEAGIGKSRLARAAAGHARVRGMAVLQGRAVATTTPVAYRPLAEALCSAVRVGAVPDTEELAPFRGTLGRLVPEWRSVGTAPVDESVVALAEAVLRFLRAAAGGHGALLVLEDLHWADPETLTIVEYLADNLSTEPALCVATSRLEDRPAALHVGRAAEARRVSEVIELSRLSAGDVADMVRSCLGSERVAEPVLRLAGRAEGVPFLVEELLAVALGAGALVQDEGSWALSTSVVPVVPLTFADSIRRRLDGLGEEARSVLFAAAVLGRRFDWEMLPAVTGLDQPAVVDALHAAVDAQVVSVDPPGPAFRFRHALSRDAVLAELLPPERAILSRRALEALEAAHPGLGPDWWELAAELAQGGDDRRRAAELLLESGRHALQTGALATSEATLERALVVAPRDDAVAAEAEEWLLEVLALVGKRDRAVDVGESLLARLGEGAGTARRRAEIHLRLARAAVAATRWDEAEDHLGRARAHAAQANDERLAARVGALGAVAALGVDEPERAAGLAREALSVAERTGLPEVACEALEVLGRCARPVDLDAAGAEFARAHAIAEAHGLTVWRVRALHELGTIDLLGSGRTGRLEEAWSLATSVGALAVAAVLDVQIAAVLALSDEPESALFHTRRAAGLARRYGLAQTLAAALGFEALVHARARRITEMEECLREAELHAGRQRDIAAVLACCRTVHAFLAEDRAEALRQLGQADVMSQGPHLGWWALVRSLDPADSDDAVAQAGAGGDPVHYLARPYLRYAEAVVLGRAGRAEEASAKVAAGDGLLRHVEWLRHYGRRLVAEAAVADGWGDPVAWLREAQAFFEGCGYDQVASACRSLLRRAGAPVPRRRQGSDQVPVPLRGLGVTARELEVLSLLAEGRSNHEIGARLYLSPRTVERHVANLAAKTGLERRSQLVAFAARAVGPEAPPP